MKAATLRVLSEWASRVDTTKATPEERKEAERRAAKALVLVMNEMTDDEVDERMHELIAQKLIEIRNEAQAS